MQSAVEEVCESHPTSAPALLHGTNHSVSPLFGVLVPRVISSAVVVM